MKDEEILRNVGRYYDGKLQLHGATARGVDWNSPESQGLRFSQLLKVCECDPGPFSILDYGCGYGALQGHMAAEGFNCAYVGYDISSAMIAKAVELRGNGSAVEFVRAESALEPADYVVASGIFNVKLDSDAEEWRRLTLETLSRFDGLSRRGFSFNMLTEYSDPDRMRPDLYYPDPCFIFDYCKTRFSRNVALLHDYELYEFTILVKKKWK